MPKCLVRSDPYQNSQDLGQTMEMEQAIAAANQAMMSHLGRHLSDVETEILKGSWNGQTYDQIAEVSGYSDSYLRRDVGTKFWRSLSQSLGESVSKNNFRGALDRYAKAHQAPPPTSVNQQKDPPISPFAKGGQREKLSPSQASLRRTELDEHDEPYVERSPLETICHDTLLQPGALVRVKAPSLMGKTLLVNHVLAQLEQEGLRTVRLSMELADRKIHFTDLNRFLRWLCINISRVLGIPNQIDNYWDEEGIGSKMSCSSYLEEYVLLESDRPLVLCLDDVDLLFPYPEIYEDVFGLLRSWYEIARSRSRKIWKRLRLAIVHATDVYIQLNLHQSPFNVGVPIELSEFTPEQIQQLAQQHGLSTQLDLTSLAEMVGGHPYLLTQAFEALNHHPDQSLTQLLANAPTKAGIYSNHLRDCWLMVRDHPEMQQMLKTVINAPEAVPLDPVQAHQLHSMGLIKLAGNIASPRCQLYRRYFQTQLEALA